MGAKLWRIANGPVEPHPGACRYTMSGLRRTDLLVVEPQPLGRAGSQVVVHDVGPPSNASVAPPARDP